MTCLFSLQATRQKWRIAVFCVTIFGLPQVFCAGVERRDLGVQFAGERPGGGGIGGGHAGKAGLWFFGSRAGPVLAGKRNVGTFDQPGFAAAVSAGVRR